MKRQMQQSANDNTTTTTTNNNKKPRGDGGGGRSPSHSPPPPPVVVVVVIDDNDEDEDVAAAAAAAAPPPPPPPPMRLPLPSVPPAAALAAALLLEAKKQNDKRKREEEEEEDKRQKSKQPMMMMADGVGCVKLSVKLPFREQAATLGHDGRTKIAKSACVMRGMEGSWESLIQQKLYDIQEFEENKHYAAERNRLVVVEHDNNGDADVKQERRMVSFKKSAFDFSLHDFSNLRDKEEIVIRVLDELRADNAKCIRDTRTRIATTMMENGEDATTSIKYKALLEERVRLAICDDDIHLPWPECLPWSILQNTRLRPYMDAWHAELEKGGGGDGGGGGGGGGA